MTQIFAVAGAWLRRPLSPERLGLALVAVAGCATAWFAAGLGTGPRLALAAAGLIALAVLARRGRVQLLATDLRGREIVLSKLAARLGNLLLTLLTGLPILCFLQFLGGVDLLLVLTGFAMTAAMMVGLAGLGVLNSVYCRRPHTAIILT